MSVRGSGPEISCGSSHFSTLSDMSSRTDWTPGPAKWIVVLILTVAIVAGLGYTLVRQGAPWRVAGAGNQAVAAGGSASAPNRLVSEPAPERSSPPKPATIAAKININTAAAAELELLPGVGPAIAERIIAEREKGGGFRRVEDLGRVRGIGPKTIEHLRPHVVVE
jgi:competence ComEA-like helix-hairpin-helix protein